MVCVSSKFYLQLIEDIWRNTDHILLYVCQTVIFGLYKSQEYSLEAAGQAFITDEMLQL